MIFNKHSALEGQHAFLGASKYHWINYDGITSELMEESMASFIRHISKRYKQIGRHCMIKFRQKGDFSKLTRFLERAKETVRIPSIFD